MARPASFLSPKSPWFRIGAQMQAEGGTNLVGYDPNEFLFDASGVAPGAAGAYAPEAALSAQYQGWTPEQQAAADAAIGNASYDAQAYQTLPPFGGTAQQALAENTRPVTIRPILGPEQTIDTPLRVDTPSFGSLALKSLSPITEGRDIPLYTPAREAINALLDNTDFRLAGGATGGKNITPAFKQIGEMVAPTRPSALDIALTAAPAVGKAGELLRGERLPLPELRAPPVRDVAPKLSAPAGEMRYPNGLEPPNRVEDAAKFNELVDSMQRGGWQGPPLVADGDQLLNGSHRYFAAREAGLPEIPVVQLDDVFRSAGLDKDAVLREIAPDGITGQDDLRALIEELPSKLINDLQLDDFAGGVYGRPSPPARPSMPDLRNRSVTEVPAYSPEARELTETAGRTLTPRSVGDTAPKGVRVGGGATEPGSDLERQLQASIDAQAAKGAGATPEPPVKAPPASSRPEPNVEPYVRMADGTKAPPTAENLQAALGRFFSRQGGQTYFRAEDGPARLNRLMDSLVNANTKAGKGGRRLFNVERDDLLIALGDAHDAGRIVESSTAGTRALGTDKGVYRWVNDAPVSDVAPATEAAGDVARVAERPPGNYGIEPGETLTPRGRVPPLSAERPPEPIDFASRAAERQAAREAREAAAAEYAARETARRTAAEQTAREADVARAAAIQARAEQLAEQRAQRAAAPANGGGGGLRRLIPTKPDFGPWSWGNELVGILGIPQTTLTMGDASAIGRDMARLGSAFPSKWKAAAADELRALGSEQTAARLQQALRDDPLRSTVTNRAGFPDRVATYKDGKQVGVGWGDEGRKAKVHFYEYGNNVPAGERVPGFTGRNESNVSKALGAYVPGLNASERAHAVGKNTLATSAYNQVADAMWKAGERRAERYDWLAHVINAGNGYGRVSAGTVGPINALFSARNLSSWVESFLNVGAAHGGINPIHLLPGQLATTPRELAAKQLASFIGANSALMGFMYATGQKTGLWSVETDARSSDWGKIRIAGTNTRIDPWAGFGPLARLVTRSAMGSTKAGGSIYPADWQTETARFLGNKQSPVFGAVTQTLFGKQNPNETTRLSPKGILGMTVPFIAQDVVNAYADTPGSLLDKAGMATAAGGLSFFGISPQTYPPSVNARVTQLMNKAASDPEVASILADPTTGKPITTWQQADSYQKEQLARAVPEIRDALANSKSDWKKVSDAKSVDLQSAADKFHEKGNSDAFRASLSNIGSKYAVEYAKLDDGNDAPAASEWKQKQADFWQQYNSLTDPNEKDHYFEAFRGSLSPAEQTRLDLITTTSSNPTAELYKQTRAYIDANYWSKGDEQYEKYVAMAPAGALLKEYPTYQQLTQAISEGDKTAMGINSKLQSLITDYKDGLRVADPKLDAMLYIWGYSDGVKTINGQRAADAWLKANDVNRPSPRLLGVPIGVK